eukprot:CAMPEP_0115077168 /NCGR_PEP_ID=MMETSP0227-20121206/16837_1 /TAXON_ID=89957 /ORGANISM="Polarella glacialis, Strain CCMP 1383" /LENGTH=354 /DNA_ID=CAMNT_0002464399 /DNA_START=339 /DNA_END=1403 /DNA_ORIENTATION=-
MLDPNAQLVFERQLQDPANLVCCDTGTADPQWASVSHGIYLSIGACGVHRSLGVRVSYVQSMSMDSWKPVHLRMMELGGNQRFNDFMAEQGVPRHMPIREKYSTRAARWYRETLRAEAEAEGGSSGSSPRSPLPLEPGTGHLPDDAGAAGSQSSEARQLLDQVFAQVPIQGSMTMGGVPLGSGLPDCQRTCWLAALTGPRSSGRPCSPPAGSSSAPKSAMRTLLLMAFGGGENSGDCRRSSFDSDGESGISTSGSGSGGTSGQQSDCDSRNSTPKPSSSSRQKHQGWGCNSNSGSPCSSSSAEAASSTTAAPPTTTPTTTTATTTATTAPRVQNSAFANLAAAHSGAFCPIEAY